MTKTEQHRVLAWRLKLLREASVTPRNVAQVCRNFGLSRRTFINGRPDTSLTVRRGRRRLAKYRVCEGCAAPFSSCDGPAGCYATFFTPMVISLFSARSAASIRSSFDAKNRNLGSKNPCRGCGDMILTFKKKSPARTRSCSSRTSSGLYLKPRR